MALRPRLRSTFTLLMVLLTTQLCINPVQSRSIVQTTANELGSEDGTEFAQSTELSDSDRTDNTAEISTDNYLRWLEQSLLRKVETLSRTVRHTEQHRVHSKRSVAKNQVTDEQLHERFYRHLTKTLQNFLRAGAASSTTFKKRSAQTINASSNTRTASAGNAKRPQIATGSFMSLCHFKICNMGKRSARSVALESPAPSNRPDKDE